MPPHIEPEVLWREGMFLCPQHLQRLSLESNARVHAAEEIGRPGAWGLVDLDVDEESLERDVFAVRSVTARFKDGTLAAYPGNTSLDQREFAEAFQTHELDVFLGIPARQSGSPELGVEGGSRARYRAEVVEEYDSNLGKAPRELELRVLQARLFFGDEEREGYESIPLARLVRRGKPVALSALSESFIPPALTCAASPVLVRRLREVADAVRAQSRDLAARIPNTTALSSAEKGADLAGFVKLQAVNQCVATLEQVARLPELHPFIAFLGLVQAAGNLAIFGQARVVPELPVYDHARMGAGFEAVLETVESLIPAEVSVPYDTIPFKKDPMREGFFLCELPKEWLAGSSLLFLGVEFAKAADEVTELVRTGVKLLAEKDLDHVLQGVVPGIELQHIRTAPLAFPKRPDLHFYRIATEGDSRDGWLKIVEAKTAVLLTALGGLGAKFHLYVELRG